MEKRPDLTEAQKWDKRWTIALLVPAAFLIMLCFLNALITAEINKNLLDNKREEIHNELGMIAAAVNADPNDPWDSHKENILQFMKFLDAKPLTFAAAYLQDGSDLLLMTERDNATNFDPRNFTEFREKIKKQDVGEIVIGFTPTGGVYRDMYLSFVWVPDYSESHERYLLVAAVSKFSITIKLNRWVSIALLVGVIACTLVLGWLIYCKLVLGHISGMRWGDTPKQKHRPLDRGN